MNRLKETIEVRLALDMIAQFTYVEASVLFNNRINRWLRSD
ncbi:hypothetical protein VCHA53O464_10173 [Vibrio chagasii]|nr:hypothetical protein VCHA53O464_10173 [Vibrio chagasii]